jgi:saccharopine dehydrogenase (NAD+, L-lysine forming)
VNGATDILVVGGYGEVGRLAAAELALRVPDRIVVSGRDEAKARAAAARLEGARSRRLDLDDPADVAAALAGVGIVVACVDRPDAAFAEACIRRGIHYVDITASNELLCDIEALEPLARANGASVVLSVGLAPGVTNLLARAATDALDRTRRVEIDILLGLGEAHGRAAVKWTLDRAHRPYALRRDHRVRLVHPFRAPHRVELPPFGVRTSYAFDFADQHVVARALDVPDVQTRLCFDSAIFTGVVAFLGAVGALRSLRWSWVRALAVRVLRWFAFGSAAFVVRAQADGSRGGQPTRVWALVHGEGEARATAVVTAFVVERLLDGDPAAGVHHIDQLVDSAAVLARLADRGFVLISSSS